jgi:hypothetical protein
MRVRRGGERTPQAALKAPRYFLGAVLVVFITAHAKELGYPSMNCNTDA